MKKVFLSTNVVVDNGAKARKAAIIVDENGKINEIIFDSEIMLEFLQNKDYQVQDYGDLYLMAGVVDSHVHVNEPGRTHWEGFETATKAAAKGGVTTIVDMPLNSIPPTTTLANFQTKQNSTNDQLYVDVGFWGGLIPNNNNDLVPLLNAGVVGFKCFLCPSGVDEFPHVQREHVVKALETMKNSNAVLAFHAEVELPSTQNEEGLDPKLYSTFLKSRPDQMEVEAIKMVLDECAKNNVRCHIVHLSSATALPMIKEFKKDPKKKELLTVETCHHYLSLNAENIPSGTTQYKCCPPIRSEANRAQLWEAIRDGTITQVVSDHSPCIASLKGLENPGDNQGGNFMKAWGGISSLQFGLSLFWTEARNRNFQVEEIGTYLSSGPARLCRVDHQKGTIRVGLDADFVVWNPNESFTVTLNEIEHKNKVTPYIGKVLYGKVYSTIVRGDVVYSHGIGFGNEKPKGKFVLRAKADI